MNINSSFTCKKVSFGDKNHSSFSAFLDAYNKGMQKHKDYPELTKTVDKELTVKSDLSKPENLNEFGNQVLKALKILHKNFLA